MENSNLIMISIILEFNEMNKLHLEWQVLS